MNKPTTKAMAKAEPVEATPADLTVTSSIRRGHMRRIARAQEELLAAVKKNCDELDRFIYLSDPDDANDTRTGDWMPVKEFRAVALDFHDMINEVLYPR
jgi:hypothetical protein